MELLSFICKEGVNRHRFKEQNLLGELVSLLKKYLYCDKNYISAQKLINSICSFAHDQDSLNFFLQNSLCDHFIDYLNNELSLSSDLESEDASYLDAKINELSIKCEHKTSECFLNKIFNLNECFILLPNPPPPPPAATKRKLDNTVSTLNFYTTTCQFNKRAKYSYSPNIFFPPPPPPLMSPSEQDLYPISPISTFSPSPPNLTSSSPPPALAYSPTTSGTLYSPLLNRSSSVTTLFDNDSETNKIKFSPSITNENSNDETVTNFSNGSCKTNVSFDFLLPPSPASTTPSKLNGFTSELINNKNIELINRTEACIFYVFSILSHGDQPSNYILNDKFFTFILNYLKLTKHTKNPRALRILNRLTKNSQCFQFFILNQFSYWIKLKFNLLFNEDENDNNKKDIQFYLSSNKVFFDSNIFPKLSSIESLVNQNLKQHCLTSGDVCYQSLLNLIKYGTIKEKLACALQMPFVLRNCKAMEHIMLQLNCLDLIIDSLCCYNEDMVLFYKSLLCIKKLMEFVNYKYNLKNIKDEYEKYKIRLQKIHEHQPLVGEKDEIEFLIDDDTCLKVDKRIITSKSEYFSLLLNGNFYEAVNNFKKIPLKDVERDCVKFIFDLLNCSLDNESGNEKSELNISFSLCLNLIELTDRFMLFDIKKFLCLFLILNYLSKCTFKECYFFSLKINCEYLTNACLDYLLARNKSVNNSFVDFSGSFKNVINISREYLHLSCLQSVLKNAISEIIKYNCWKFY